MRNLLQILLFLLICSPLAHGDDYGQVTVTKSLPEVECTSDLLNAEILHYLSQQDKSDEIRYWNLNLKIENDIYDMPAVYRCIISREPDFIPDEGIAYLRYGNNILVVEEESDMSLFTDQEGRELNLSMIRNRLPMQAYVAYLVVVFCGNKVFRIKSERD